MSYTVGITQRYLLPLYELYNITEFKLMSYPTCGALHTTISYGSAPPLGNIQNINETRF